MASNAELDALIEHVMALSRLVSLQQGQMRAVLAYLHEQPTTDSDHLAALLKQEQEHLEKLRKAFLGEAGLFQALLQDFEGPPQ